ncbi:unnamed protein product [Amoebophrya sp. A25]|nr:unnamed protein product [Amoebophrya sp. A25]|eukprot:GSA25T00013606001.1
MIAKEGHMQMERARMQPHVPRHNRYVEDVDLGRLPEMITDAFKKWHSTGRNAEARTKIMKDQPWFLGPGRQVRQLVPEESSVGEWVLQKLPARSRRSEWWEKYGLPGWDKKLS